jgi:proteic killer suppression protein
LATLASKGRIRLDISLESFLQEVEARFIVLPISGRACARITGLPASYPKDPADRIIGATALVEGLYLLTADGEIRRSRTVQTIWWAQQQWLNQQSCHDSKRYPGRQQWTLEALRGDRHGQHSIRIDDQWRICFIWRDGHCYDVEIVDHH